MTRTHCLVKISGDVLLDEVLAWVVGLSVKHFVVVCVGGGTQINEAFQEAGYEVAPFGPLGREANTFPERQLARDVLEENQMEVQDRLTALGASSVSVVIPVLDVGTVLCHVNGDTYVLAAYLGFERIYVVTTPERLGEKREQFGDYPKIQVVAPGHLPEP